MFASGTTTLVYSNEDLKDIMKIIKSLEGSGLLIFVNETIKNKAKQKSSRFHGRQFVH